MVFAVIEGYDGRECDQRYIEVVPESWLKPHPTIDNMLSMAFPPKSSSARSFIVKQQPPEGSWPIFTVKLLKGDIGTYTEAQGSSKRREFVTDTDSEVDVEARRKIAKKNHPLSKNNGIGGSNFNKHFMSQPPSTSRSSSSSSGGRQSQKFDARSIFKQESLNQSEDLFSSPPVDTQNTDSLYDHILLVPSPEPDKLAAPVFSEASTQTLLQLIYSAVTTGQQEIRNDITRIQSDVARIKSNMESLRSELRERSAMGDEVEDNLDNSFSMKMPQKVITSEAQLEAAEELFIAGTKEHFKEMVSKAFCF